MKRIVQRLIFVLIIIDLPSCTKEYCLTPYIEGVGFNYQPPFTDTGIILMEYAKGSNFSKLLDSFSVPVDSQILGPFSEAGFGFPYDATAPNGTAYYFDWVIKLYPSNKIIKLSDINHSNSYVKIGINQEIEDNCVNSVTYMVNDTSLHTVNTNTVSSTSASCFIYVNYL